MADSRRPPVMIALALLLAAGGQLLIVREAGPPWLPPLLWALAALLTMLGWGARPVAPDRPAAPPTGPRKGALIAALALALVGWLGSAENSFRLWGVAAWWGSVPLWLYAWRVDARAAPPDAREPWRPWQLVALALILVGATLFRFWEIDTLPLEMTSDHAEKLLDVQDILDGQRPIFLERNTGREPMQFYLTALLAGPLGLGTSYLALKVGTALISLATVVLAYPMARHGLGLPRAVALMAMALLAASKWHVEISRVGLRFPYAPFGVALTLLFFFRALRRHERRDWLLTGAAFGVALYGYTPIRIVPLVLAVGALLWLVLAQGRGRTGLAWRDALANVALAPLTTLVVFAPLLRYSLDRPDQFWYRSATRLLEGDVPTSLPARFLHNLWNAARMFHYQGDVVWVNTVPYDPTLDRVTGALFIVGVGVVLGAVLRRWRPAELTLLLALPILILPSVLALAWPDENPSVVRAGGALPVIAVLAALPLWPLGAWATRPGRGARFRAGFVAAVAAGLLLVVGQRNAEVYFGPYDVQHRQTAANATEVADAIARRAAEIGGIEHAYLLSYPHWMDTRNVGINLGAPRWENVLHTLPAVNDPEAYEHEPRLVVLPAGAVAERDALLQLWPGAEVELVTSRVPNRNVILVLKPR